MEARDGRVQVLRRFQADTEFQGDHILSTRFDWLKLGRTEPAATSIALCDTVANVSSLSSVLRRDWDRALLFRDLATLRIDIRLFTNVDTLRWAGPRPEYDELAHRLDAATTAKVPGNRAKPARQSNQSR
jgi:hypothetical protein